MENSLYLASSIFEDCDFSSNIYGSYDENVDALTSLIVVLYLITLSTSDIKTHITRGCFVNNEFETKQKGVFACKNERNIENY